jgi:predicted transposase YdaD
MSGNHDLGYKQLFAHPEMVRDLLAGFTEFECFRSLAVDAFERVNASYVSEQFSERHGDMVWKVRLADHVVYVYLLLEFQSTPERWMALRMQVYVGLLYQDLVKRHELAPSAGLPPVLPVVFYNGKAAWSASEELRHLVATRPEELDPYQASQRYLLIDQTRLDPEALDSARNLVAAMFRIELSESADILMDVASTLGVWLAGEEQCVLRQGILNWIARLQKGLKHGELIPEVQRLLEGEAMGERLQRRYANMVEYILDAGLQKGLARGREEGKLLALREILKLHLAQRFGPVPAEVAQRIDEAAQDELERWIGGVVSGDSIDAVLAS